MRENIFREVDAEYDRVRAENRAEEARRFAEASAADPQIAALTERRASMLRERVNAAFANPNHALEISEALQRDMAALQAEMRARLVEAGFAKDYLQPVYRCPVCRDTGFVGEPIRERCACYQHRVSKTLLSDSDSGLDPSQTFDAYDESIFPDAPDTQTGASQRGYMARIRTICFDYATQFPATERSNLLMLGMSGLGKTFLLNCIGNHVAAKGIPVLKITAYQLTERMRAAVFERQPEAFSGLLTVPLLLLDDLGVEPLINNITIEQLFTLLNERGLAGLHTVISTNLMPDELQRRYTERVCSRLFDTRATSMLLFKGSDVRLRRAP